TSERGRLPPADELESPADRPGRASSGAVASATSILAPGHPAARVSKFLASRRRPPALRTQTECPAAAARPGPTARRTRAAGPCDRPRARRRRNPLAGQDHPRRPEEKRKERGWPPPRLPARHRRSPG